MADASCERCHSRLQPDDLRCAVCALPTPADSKRAAAAAQVLRCHGCGAAVRYRAEVQAPQCDFCGAVMELSTPSDPVEQAETYVDFTVSEAEARAALSAWLGRRSFFRPRDLQAGTAVERLRPLWWVGWCFDAEAAVCWAADSNAGSRRSSWAPHSGQFEMKARNVVVPASVGLTHDECRALTKHYDLSRSSDSPKGHGSATIEQFTVQRSAARVIVSNALTQVAKHQATPRIPGRRHRKLSVSVLPSRLSSRHYAFPAYVLAYRYRDTLYRAVVHGQDPQCVIGRAPLSWGRIAAVVFGVLAVVALVLAVAASA